VPKGQCPVLTNSATAPANISWWLILVIGLAGGYILGKESRRYGGK